MSTLSCALVMMFLWVGHARADWLIALPECAMDDIRAPGPTKLLYPRPGLPAVVAPGEELVTRVRVPAPLTPPPGIQQERALRGWNIELRGRADVQIGRAEWRYRIRVRDVRPDGQASLVYRATIRVPPYASPGIYSLSMSAPWGGESVSVASVVVTEPGAAPRIARLDGTADAWLMRHDPNVDVWLVSGASAALREPLVAQGAPWLDAEHRGALLEVGEHQLLELGDCAQGFNRLSNIADAHGGQRRELASIETRALAEDQAVLRGLSLHNQSNAPQRLSVLVPEDGMGTSLGAETRWYPAVPIEPSGHIPSLVAHIDLAAHTTLEYERSEAQGRAEILSPTTEVRAGERGELKVQTNGLNGPTWVAWSWGEDREAWTPGDEPLWAHFGQAERHEVHVVALGADGQARRASLALQIRSQADEGCSAAGPGGHAGILAMFLVLCRIRRPRYKD